MDIKVCLLDFDGTLVKEDILTLLCGIAGKHKESEDLNDAFNRGEVKGITGLVARINLLNGVTNNQIMELLSKDDHLMPGAKELIQFLKENKIITILASGSIISVLEHYQRLLDIDYIIGSRPEIVEGKIVGISESAYSSLDFKVDGIKGIIDSMHLSKENIIAIGDSPADKGMFELSGYSVAFNPKGNIADFADAVVNDDLNKVVELLNSRIHSVS